MEDGALESWISSALGVWFVLLGLAIGSFLNVVIARVPRGESIVRPRSRCPRCGHSLPWYENIPVFSWLFLRGRCSSCKAPISFRYPAVELLTAALLLACLLRFGWTWELVRASVLVTLLVPLSFIDLEHWLLPFELTLPGIALGLLLAIPLGTPALRNAVIGAAGGFLFFWLLEWVGGKIFKKEALGGGDKYLLALLGAFLSFQALLGVVFLSSLQASVVGITLLLVRGRAGPAPTPEEPREEGAPPAAKDSAPGAAGSEGDQPEATGLEVEGKEDEEEDDWVPGPTNLPLGPWLSLAGLEILLLAPLLCERFSWPVGLLFGCR